MTDMIHIISGASGSPIAVDRRPSLQDRLNHRITRPTKRNHPIKNEESNDRNRLHPPPVKFSTAAATPP